jgi:hypothetical protein
MICFVDRWHWTWRICDLENLQFFKIFQIFLCLLKLLLSIWLAIFRQPSWPRIEKLKNTTKINQLHMLILTLVTMLMACGSWKSISFLKNSYQTILYAYGNNNFKHRNLNLNSIVNQYEYCITFIILCRSVAFKVSYHRRLDTSMLLQSIHDSDWNIENDNKF